MHGSEHKPQTPHPAECGSWLGGLCGSPHMQPCHVTKPLLHLTLTTQLVSMLSQWPLAAGKLKGRSATSARLHSTRNGQDNAGQASIAGPEPVSEEMLQPRCNRCNPYSTAVSTVNHNRNKEQELWHTRQSVACSARCSTLVLAE
jgi:hypothetical protein